MVHRLCWNPALLIACFVLAAAPAASAQEGPRPSVRGRIETAALRALYVSAPAVQAFDAVTTLRVLELGGREVNPMMAAVASNQTAFTAVKLGVAAGQIYGAHALAKRHRLLAIGVMAGVNAAFAVMAVHNLDVARSLGAARSPARR